jgi:hypothetical protein
MRSKYKRKKQRQQTFEQSPTPIAPGIDQKLAAEPKSPTEGQERQEESMSFVTLFKNDPKFRVEVAAVLVGILVLIVYGFQLRAMRSQLTAMQDAMKLERPWIGPTGRKNIAQNTVDSKGKPIYKLSGVEWYFQNGGRTAATRTRIHIVIKIGPPTPSTVFTPRNDLPKNDVCEKGELDSSFGDFTVIPGIPNNSFNARFAAPGNYGSIDDVLASGHNMWLVGCVDYSDSSFKPWFRTDVLEYWNQQDNSFALWQIGNDAR